MARRNNSLLGWFGLTDQPSWTRAKTLGPLLTVFAAIILFALVYRFLEALLGFGPEISMEDRSSAIRNYGLAVAAVLGLPFLVWRSLVAQRQVDTAQAALLNDKLNAASADLYAQRQVTHGVGKDAFNGWEDDVVRRIAGMDRLLGLVEEEPEFAPRVGSILNRYIKEMSVQFPAAQFVEEDEPEGYLYWADSLRPARPDMEACVQNLGKLRSIAPEAMEQYRFDFANCNLQGFRLMGLDLSNADFSVTSMENASLVDSIVTGCYFEDAALTCISGRLVDFGLSRFSECKILGPDLYGCSFKCCNFTECSIRGGEMRYSLFNETTSRNLEFREVDLSGSEFHGADLDMAFDTKTWVSGCEFHGAQLYFGMTPGVIADRLERANLQGLYLRSADLTSSKELMNHLDRFFADASVILPLNKDYPKHWARDANGNPTSDPEIAEAQWRAWLKTL